MEITYIVYVCDLCYREIKEDSPRSVWFIDDIKHDVCVDCVSHFGELPKEDEDAG